MKNNVFTWQWKDNQRHEWKMTASPSGDYENVSESNPDGDLIWLWFLYDEAGIFCGTEQSYVWSGSFTGQGTHPPSLKLLLLAWLNQVRQVVIDGVTDETIKRFTNADGSQ